MNAAYDPDTLAELAARDLQNRQIAEAEAKCLRALTVQQVLDHQAGVLRVVPDFPTVDGTVMTHKALDAFSTGMFNQVPIINGTNHDEGRIVVALNYDLAEGVGPLQPVALVGPEPGHHLAQRIICS